MAVKALNGCVGKLLLFSLSLELLLTTASAARTTPAADAVRTDPIFAGAEGTGAGRRGAASDDPHFTSPDGVAFDFHGALDKSFCFTTDTRLQINALVRGYKDKRPFGASAPDEKGLKLRTWMKELGILWKDDDGHSHSMRMLARVAKQAERGKGFLAKVEVDGKGVKLPYDGTQIEKAGMHFTFARATITPKEEEETFYLVVEGQVGAVIVMRPANQQLRTNTDAEVHFNLNFYALNATEKIHGVLGQTYREDPERVLRGQKFKAKSLAEKKPVQADQISGKGYLDGEVKDYITSSVTSADCKFSVFKQ